MITNTPQDTETNSVDDDSSQQDGHALQNGHEAGADTVSSESTVPTEGTVPTEENTVSEDIAEEKAPVTFSDIGLGPKVLKALSESGYTHPTPIQEAAIPEALSGRDVLGIAQTGTGKTASFTLPMIERLSKGRARARMPRSLVLAPTRELAAQVSENFEKYGQYHKLSMALLIGGVSFGDQDAKLTRGVDVLIATPGRLLDHFERGRLLLTGIEVMVVDEADRMLDMGFIPDIERIFNLTPMTRQTLFFSATMPPEIQRITDTFLHKPARVEVSRPAMTAETITQNIVTIPSKDDRAKRLILREMLKMDGVRNGIIFCNRKSTVDIVAKSLQKYEFSARPIHGDLTQSFRMETLDQFREGQTQFLVASDVAARGLDIPDVSHVFNFDVPIHADDYVHRIGRTGRAGRKGHTLMLVTPKDAKALDAILKTIGRDAIAELEGFGGVVADAVSEAGKKPGRRAAKPSTRRASNRDTDQAGNEDEQSGQHKARSTRHRSRPNREEGKRRANADHSSNRDGDQAQRRAPKPRREKWVDEDPVVGLGDHVPAFLKR